MSKEEKDKCKKFIGKMFCLDFHIKWTIKGVVLPWADSPLQQIFEIETHNLKSGEKSCEKIEYSAIKELYEKFRLYPVVNG